MSINENKLLCVYIYDILNINENKLLLTDFTMLSERTQKKSTSCMIPFQKKRQLMSNVRGRDGGYPLEDNGD